MTELGSAFALVVLLCLAIIVINLLRLLRSKSPPTCNEPGRHCYGRHDEGDE